MVCGIQVFHHVFTVFFGDELKVYLGGYKVATVSQIFMTFIAMGIIEDCWSDPGDFVAVRPLYGILTGSWLRRCGGSDAEERQTG